MNELILASRQKGITTAETFTYILIVIVSASTAYGFYFNYNLENAIADAVESGMARKEQIEAFFEAEGFMPQTEAEAGLNEFTPVGVLTDFTWEPGAFGESGSDPQLTGTLNAIVDLSEFGARFEETESAYLLIARAQEDGTILWDCKADPVTLNALSQRYLPDNCQSASDGEDE